MKKFTLKQLLPDIYQLTEPFFTEHANMYLLAGGAQGDLLVDCGTGYYDVKEFLQTQGFNPNVFLTHCHFDHVGGLKHFHPHEVYATDKTFTNLCQPNLWGLDYLCPKDFATGLQAEKWCQEFTPILSTTGMHVVSGRIKVGHYDFEIIPTPGHSDDSICLYDAHAKILISGDTLYDGTLMADFENSSKTDFLQSLQKIQTLNFEVVLPGHNQLLKKSTATEVISQWTQKLQTT